MYSKILVPVDGSDTSLRGLNEAIKIAMSQHSALCLLHVVNEFVFDYSYSPASYSSTVIDVVRERGNSILADAAALAQAQGVKADVVLLESIGVPAADLIISEAAKYGANLIVMGTHGRRGFRRFAMGSDAEQVVRMANVPVLLLRDKPPAAAQHSKAAA